MHGSYAVLIMSTELIYTFYTSPPGTGRRAQSNTNLTSVRKYSTFLNQHMTAVCLNNSTTAGLIQYTAESIGATRNELDCWDFEQ